MDRRIKASIVSIITDLLLIGVKAALGFLTGSLAIWADFFHSASDLLVSGIVLSGILLRRRREKHDARTRDIEGGGESEEPGIAHGRRGPGYRIESLAALVVSVIILSVPFEIIRVYTKAEQADASNVWSAVLGVMVCILCSYFISRFKIIVGRSADSPALVADGYHSRMDMFTSIAVLLSLMAGWIGIEADGITAVIIAVLIAVTGLELLKTTLVSLIKHTDLSLIPLWPGIYGFFRRWFGIADETGSEMEPGGFGSRAVRRTPVFFSKGRSISLSILVVVVYLFTGLTIVRPGEVGIRLRFGAIAASDLGPGLYYHLPPPFERMVKVEVKRVHRVELGFRTDQRFGREYSLLLWDTKHRNVGFVKKAEESVTLTGDENLVDICLVVHFQPRNPVQYEFGINGIDEIMRGLSESTVRLVLSTEHVNELLTGHRAKVLALIREKIQEKAEKLELGVDTLNVYCQDLHPPLEVLHAVRDVFSAREDRAKAINEAQAYSNVSLPHARARVHETITEAEIYGEDKRIRSEGEAVRFELTARAFKTAPEITIYRLFIETAEQCMFKRKKIIADPQINQGEYRRWLFLPPYTAEVRNGAGLNNAARSRAPMPE